jgi:hypothetical protein
MLNAASLMRTATFVLCCALAMLRSSAALGQPTIDISLNLYYADPMDSDSGGTWQIVAKTSAVGGISQLSLRLDDIDGSSVQFHAPRGIVNAIDAAGFYINANSPQGSSQNVTISQAGLTSDFDPGDEQNIFYGVGTITNGQPGDVGPAFTSLTSVQGEVPWAPVPPPDGRATIYGVDAADWEVAALFASGDFAEGATPSLLATTTGLAFNTVGTSMMFAPSVTAMINRFVYDNLEDGGPGSGLAGDYNDNDVVDAADYVVWRKNNGGITPLPNDGGLGIPINSAHYALWRTHFGETAPGGGAGASSAVPEPAAAVLFVLGIGLLAPCRNGQKACRIGRSLVRN